MRLGRIDALLAPAIALAACGGAAETHPAATAPASSVAVEGIPSTASMTPPRTPVPPTEPATSLPPHQVAVDMKAPVPSIMLSDLQAIGLDSRSLPPIEKIEPKALRRAMKILAKSLGAKCGDCHLEGDFAAPTRRKKIAAKMWDEFAAKLAMADDSPIFCDSCHQGRTVLLDRTDKNQLARWMDVNFVEKLKRKDGAEHVCETCHIDKEKGFLDTWAQ